MHRINICHQRYSYHYRAVGVLSYIILVGYPPFHDNAPLRLKTKIIRGVYEFHPAYWDVISAEGKDFVSRLLTVDMAARMTAEQALQHPWVRGHLLYDIDLINCCVSFGSCIV